MNNQNSEPSDSYFALPTVISTILSSLPCLQDQYLIENANTHLMKKRLMQNWREIVGPKLAEHTRPITIRNQKLLVMVNEPRWMVAVQQIEESLGKRINEFIKLSQPLGLEFILGEISSFTNLHPPSRPSRTKIKLTSEQESKIENLTCLIKDNDKLKQTLKSILTKHYHHTQNLSQ